MEQLTDVISESAVLSAVINNGADCYIDLAELINCDTFTDEQYSALWKCFAEIFKGETKKTDIPSILVTAKDLGLGIFFDTETKQKTLKRICGLVIEPDSALRFAKKLRRLQVARILDNSLDKAKKSLLSVTGVESIAEIISRAEKPIYDTVNLVDGVSVEGAVHISTGLRDLIQHIEDNPNQSLGIPSGFPEWDESIGGGLTPGIHVVGARLKGGKSHFADNAGTNIALQGYPVKIVDVEMQKGKHHFRLLSLFSGVPVLEIKKGKYVSRPSDVKKIRQAEKILNDLPYTYLWAGNMSMEERLSHMRRWLLRTVGYGDNGKIKPCVIFYDQLKVTDPTSLDSMAEHQALGFQVDGLHNFSIQYEVPIVALTQLNRDGINNQSTAAVANSDKIAQACTSLTFLKWKSPEEIAKDGPELGNKKMIVVAGRDGAEHLGEGQYIHVGTNLSIARMFELGSTTRPKKTAQKFDIEAVQEINF